MADLVEQWDQLVATLSGLVDPDRGTVRLAFLDSIAASLVPHLLKGFRENAPQMSVLLRQEPGHEIRRDLGDGTAELALISPRPEGPYDWYLVTVPVGFGFRTLVDGLFAAAGLEPRVSLEITDLATIEGLVAVGLGVALLPEALAGTTGSVPLALEGSEAHRVVGLTWRADRELSTPAARFVEYVREMAGNGETLPVR